MGSISGPTFHDGTPRMISATVTLGAGETLFEPGCFLYDPQNYQGAPLVPIPPGSTTLWAEYDWQPNNIYKPYAAFGHTANSQGTAPAVRAVAKDAEKTKPASKS
jgi:hypothetical protein